MTYISIFSYLFMTIFLSVCYYLKDPHTSWKTYVIIFLFGIPYEWIRSKWFNASMKRKKESLMQEEDPELGEPILEKACMNHLQGIIADGGIGYQLQDKLIFIPHKMNLSRKQVTILFSEIDRISSYKIWGVFDTGLKIILKSGKIEKFVVDKNEKIFQKLINLN